MTRFGPLRVPPYRRLAGAYAISRIGDVLAIVALALVVWDRTHSTYATTGLFVALEFLPALAGPLLAARLDRLPLRRILPELYVLEAAVFAVLALLSESFSLGSFLALVAIDGMLGVVARGLCRGAVAGVLEPTGGLREGNALLNLAVAPGMAIGGIAGGAIVAGFGGGAALLVNAGSFLVAAVLVGTARGLPRGDSLSGPADDFERWRDRIAATGAYLRGNRMVTTLMALQALALVFFALTEPIEVVYTRASLGAGPGGYGALIAAWGGGVVIGSLVYTWVGSTRLMATAALSTALLGLAYIALAVAPGIGVACVVAVVGGTANGAQMVAIGTAIQEAVALDQQARVMSVFEAVTTASPGLGYLAGGAVAAAAGGRAAFLVAGGGVLVVLAVGVAARPWREDGAARAPVGAAARRA